MTTTKCTAAELKPGDVLQSGEQVVQISGQGAECIARLRVYMTNGRVQTWRSDAEVYVTKGN